MRQTKLIATAALLLGLALPLVAAAPAQALSLQPLTTSTTTFGDGLFRNLWNTVTGQTSTTNQTPAQQTAPTPQPATPQATVTGKYVALGDSVAAGWGLPAVANASARDTQCGRSSQAYATIVAQTLQTPLTNAACSGATVGDLFTKQGVDGPNITSQLKTAYTGGQPSLITITAGANDAHWDSFIKACYQANCANKTATTAANAYLKLLQAKLHGAFTAINVRSNGNPPAVYITGYYNPLLQACIAQQTNINQAEITWISAETNALNKTIEQVAKKYSFVTYVPVDFTGHDICSSDSWIQGAGSTAPFHPTAAGQAAIAKALLTSMGR